MTITIDTHEAIRNLEAAGADTKLAEAIVATVSRADSSLATKADIAAVQADLAAVKSDLEAAVQKAIVQVILAQVLIAGVAVAFLKLA